MPVFCRRLLAVFFWLSISFTGLCQELNFQFGVVPEAELKMDVYAKDTSAAAVILYDSGESSFLFHENTRVHFKRTMRLKILKKAGLEQANIEIPFYKLSHSRKEEITEIQGYTHTMEKGKASKTQLAATNIFEEQQDGYLVHMKIAMPNVKVGSVIELSYVLTSDFTQYLPEWKFQNVLPIVWSEYKANMVPFYGYRQMFTGKDLPFHIKESKTAIQDVPSDFFISAPLSAAYALIAGLSFAIVADEAGQWLFRSREVISRAMYYFCGLLVVSWLTLLLSIAGWISVGVLQICVVCIVVTALVITLKKRGRVLFANSITISRNGKLILLAVAIPLVLLALSPPTDADSVDYHLGVPVQILRNHSLDFDGAHLHFRMFGFGEMLNIIGVATGAISLGALLQLIGLFWLVAVYKDYLSGTSLATIIMLVMALPVLIALVPTSKHQLTGACCTAICFAYISGHKRPGNSGLILPFLLCLLFAAGIKYSFILSAALLLLYWLIRVKPFKLNTVITAFGLSMIVIGPLALFRFWHYHDPFSPLLEGYRPYPDPAIQWFSSFIRSYTDSGFPFPLSIVVPSSPGVVAACLGWGAIVLLSAFLFYREHPLELIVVGSLLLLTICFGQRTARFFIEPYLWVLPLWIISSHKWRWGKYLVLGAKAQCLLLIPLVCFMSFRLGKGVVSNARREKVLQQSASFYAEAQWINSIVPKNAVLLTDVRSRAFLDPPLFPIEYYYAFGHHYETSVRLDTMIHDKYHVAYYALINPPPWFIDKYCGQLIAGPRRFPVSSRNPFNRAEYQLSIYSAKPGNP